MHVWAIRARMLTLLPLSECTAHDHYAVTGSILHDVLFVFCCSHHYRIVFLKAWLLVSLNLYKKCLKVIKNTKHNKTLKFWIRIDFCLLILLNLYLKLTFILTCLSPFIFWIAINCLKFIITPTGTTIEFEQYKRPYV